MCRRVSEGEDLRLGVPLVVSLRGHKRHTGQAAVPVAYDIWREKRVSKLADSRAREDG